MAVTIRSALASAVDSAATDAAAAQLASDLGANAVIEIRTGTKPATPETAASGTLLASVTIASWTAATGGTGTVTGSNPAAVTVAATGTAGHFRAKQSGGTAVIDGTVGTSGADLNLDSVSLVSGGSLDLGAPVFTYPVTVPVS